MENNSNIQFYTCILFISCFFFPFFFFLGPWDVPLFIWSLDDWYFRRPQAAGLARRTWLCLKSSPSYTSHRRGLPTSVIIRLLQEEASALRLLSSSASLLQMLALQLGNPCRQHLAPTAGLTGRSAFCHFGFLALNSSSLTYSLRQWAETSRTQFLI